jgi:hypothetical protein
MSSVNKGLESVEDLLIYLAKNANPKRFLPFPTEYKIIPTLNTTSNIEGKIVSTYTEEEYKRMYEDLQKLPKEANKYPQLMKYILNTEIKMAFHGRNSIHNSIVEYQFLYSPLEERIRDYKHRSRHYLFHGSPIGNWHSLLRNGIKNMSGTEFMTTGAILGNGVYLTNDISTAHGYGGNNGKISCVSVVEILTDIEPYKKNAQVYVIPDDTKLVVRYLYAMDNYPIFQGIEVLEYYKKLSDSRFKNKVMTKRIIDEKKILVDNGTIILDSKNTEILQIEYKGVSLRVYIDKFPFAAPLIQLMYEPKNNIPSLWMQSDWSPMFTILSTIKKYIDGITPTLVNTNNSLNFTNKLIPEL